MKLFDYRNPTRIRHIELLGKRAEVMNHKRQIVTSNRLMVIVCLFAIVMVVGCAHSPGVGGGAGAAGAVHTPRLLQTADATDESADAEDYDPWEPFNEKMFSFNHDILDRYLVKPAAQGWSYIMPTVARQSISRL